MLLSCSCCCSVSGSCSPRLALEFTHCTEFSSIKSGQSDSVRSAVYPLSRFVLAMKTVSRKKRIVQRKDLDKKNESPERMICNIAFLLSHFGSIGNRIQLAGGDCSSFSLFCARADIHGRLHSSVAIFNRCELSGGNRDLNEQQETTGLCNRIDELVACFHFVSCFFVFRESQKGVCSNVSQR